MAVPTISVEAFRRLQAQGDDFVVIDVREAWERDLSCIPGSIHIPLGSLDPEALTIGKDEKIVVHCEHGIRSQKAALALIAGGFTDVLSLDGGIARYLDQEKI